MSLTDNAIGCWKNHVNVVLLEVTTSCSRDSDAVRPLTPCREFIVSAWSVYSNSEHQSSVGSSMISTVSCNGWFRVLLVEICGAHQERKASLLIRLAKHKWSVHTTFRGFNFAVCFSLLHLNPAVWLTISWPFRGMIDVNCSVGLLDLGVLADSPLPEKWKHYVQIDDLLLNILKESTGKYVDGAHNTTFQCKSVTTCVQ